MRGNILNSILKYKEGNNEFILKIMDTFNPVINKYAKLLDGEDTRHDLIVYLIKLMEKINLNNEDFYKDKIIFSYIAKSIRNEYIRLSRLKSRRLINEIELNLELEIACEDGCLEFELLDLFKLLTQKEAYIMKLIYVYSLSVSEVSQYMNISRQAVNQTKNRALKKIERFI